MMTVQTLGMIQPILAMVGLTFVSFWILYARRLPAMRRIGIEPNAFRDPSIAEKLPAAAQYAAQNYNHLFEMPVLFYVLAFVTILIGAVDPISVGLAWAYVGLRAAHMLVQVTSNEVLLRFLLFFVSALVLMALFILLTLAVIQL